MIAVAENAGASQYSSLIFLALLFGAMYFLMIRPQQRRRRQFMDLLSSLEVGDEIETVAGIFGTIRRLDDEHAWVEVAEGTTLKMSRAAIRRKIVAEQETEAS
ncbi:MAG: preprotein translocase subunit YajC [Actinomycetota bacterium]